jgi:hypothetical protein
MVDVAALQSHSPNILAWFDALDAYPAGARSALSADPGNSKASTALTTFDTYDGSALQRNRDAFQTCAHRRNVDCVRPDIKQLPAEIEAPHPYRESDAHPAFTRFFHMASLGDFGT